MSEREGGERRREEGVCLFLLSSIIPCAEQHEAGARGSNPGLGERVTYPHSRARERARDVPSQWGERERERVSLNGLQQYITLLRWN